MYKLNILLLQDLNSIPNRKSFILSALNATSLAHRISCDVRLDTQFYFFWLDGILSRLITFKGNRVPGRILLNHMLLNFSKKKISVDIIGTLNNNSLNFLNSINLKFNYIDVPISDAKSIAEIASKEIKFSNVILLLPSPKQEQVSEFLIIKKPAKYYCFGGALNMLSGNENPAPSFVVFLGIEFLWRLQNDTLRRIFRFFWIIQHIFKFKRERFICRYY